MRATTRVGLMMMVHWDYISQRDGTRERVTPTVKYLFYFKATIIYV